MTESLEEIEDPTELARVRRQARTIQLKAVLAAILVTCIALLAPQPQRRKARSGATSRGRTMVGRDSR